jgi:hypothetical protein
LAVELSGMAFATAVPRPHVTLTFFCEHFLNNESTAITQEDWRNLTLSDPTSNLVRQYDFPVLLRCRKMSDMVFVAFVRPLLEPV